MAGTTETMRNAQEALMQGIRHIASKLATKLATGDLRSGDITEMADNLAKLNSGIEALETAIARDEGDAGA